MKEKIHILYVVLFTLLICSCTNLINNSETKNITFSLDEASSKYITSSLSRNITQDSPITITAILYKDGNEVSKESSSSTLKDFENEVIRFNSLPLGYIYKIKLEISSNGTILFTGESNNIPLTEDESDVSVSIDIDKVYYNITYVLNDGVNNSLAPVKYFPGNSITLLSPTKGSDTFLGWYLTKECDGKEIKTLGISSDANGNVTLYAKWKKESISILPEKESLTKDEKVTLVPSLSSSNVYYTIDGSDPENSPTRVLYTSSFTIDKDVTVKAYMENNGKPIRNEKQYKRLYTVSFEKEGHGSEEVKEQNLMAGDKITNPGVLSEDGLTFNGWYSSKPFTTPFDFKNTTVSSDTVLYAKWTDNPPEAISDLCVKGGDKEVTLSWTNPTVGDFSKVIITYQKDGSSTTEEVSGITDTTKGKKISHTVTSLTNGSKYTFTIKAVDKGNNNSKPSSAYCYPMFPLTEKPVLAEGYVSKTGESGTYYKFGDYPQSVSEPGVKFSSETVKVNGFECKYGSDGYYYYEQGNPDIDSSITDMAFDDGTPIEQKIYRYKMESIVWRVLDSHYKDKSGEEKGTLLVADTIIDHMNFYPNQARPIEPGSYTYIDDNSYEFSKLRSYLNGTPYTTAYSPDQTFVDNVLVGKGFLQKAFTPEAQKLIIPVLVDNSAQSIVGSSETAPIGEKVCNDTTDQVFSLSVYELTTPSYGLTNKTRYTSEWMRGTSGAKIATASNSKVQSNQKLINSMKYWLRSPAPDKTNPSGDQERFIDIDGLMGSDYVSSNYGILPTIVIKL